MAGRKTRHKDRESGFTLIELLVVMIIIGLLAALVGPGLFSTLGKSKLKSAKAQIELFGTALDAFRLEIGRYPTSEEGLQALRENPGEAAGWDGPYLRKEVPLDPWGKPYHYQSPGEQGDYDLFSYGADRSPGGEGENQDIASWKRLE
ncbi:MAG: type II secretion system major pseudopilin GspG [Nitrospiria bacterium]